MKLEINSKRKTKFYKYVKIKHTKQPMDQKNQKWN